jgi:hypothetical protein
VYAAHHHGEQLRLRVHGGTDAHELHRIMTAKAPVTITIFRPVTITIIRPASRGQQEAPPAIARLLLLRKRLLRSGQWLQVWRRVAPAAAVSARPHAVKRLVFLLISPPRIPA